MKTRYGKVVQFIQPLTPVQLVEALYYNPEGRQSDPQWGHWDFSLNQSVRPHYGHGVDSASNRNEYQEYLLGLKVAGV
jgi:hypothetical protein